MARSNEALAEQMLSANKPSGISGSLGVFLWATIGRRCRVSARVFQYLAIEQVAPNALRAGRVRTYERCVIDGNSVSGEAQKLKMKATQGNLRQIKAI